MEFWIRSQNRQNLMKVNDIVVGYNKILVYKDDEASTEIGEYKTKERALEVLDEIQSKMRGKFLLKPKNILKPSTVVDAKYYFEHLNNIELITVDNNFDILPISDGVVIYEMPKE